MKIRGIVNSNRKGTLLMKRLIFISFFFLFLSSFFFLSSPETNAQDLPFEVTNIDQNWEWEFFKTIEFPSAAITFDRKGNLYANDFISNFGPGDKKIIRYEAPEYEEMSEYLTYKTDYEGITGMDFDRIGNLFVSEIMGSTSGSDAGAIRKINTRTLKVSDPIEFINIGDDGDFRPTGIATTGVGKIYFPGRKNSDPYWGNIYKINSFNKYDPNIGPMVYDEGAIWTAIAADKWGNLYYSVSSVKSNYEPNSIYTLNPYTKIEVLIATFNQYVEELTFDSKGNLYVLEGLDTYYPSTVIMLKPPYISIDDCNTGIIDWPLPDGSLISEMIENCEETSENHVGFLSCVAHGISQLNRDDIISKEQMIPISSCMLKSLLLSIRK